MFNVLLIVLVMLLIIGLLYLTCVMFFWHQHPLESLNCVSITICHIVLLKTSKVCKQTQCTEETFLTL